MRKVKNDFRQNIKKILIKKKFHCPAQTAFNRVCLYLTSCVPYVPEPDNTTLLTTALEIFRKFDRYPQALRLALQLNDSKLILEIFQECKDPVMQKQLAFMLGRHQHFLAVSNVFVNFRFNSCI